MGWGKQTFAMAAMMALGEMPHVDFIVFADTGHEGIGTYEFIRQWTPWLEEHGLSLVTVSAESTDVVREDWAGSVLIPAFTLDIKGHLGQVRRQCTHDWKITPIRRFMRTELERRGLRPTAGVAESWQGISLDEFQRMRDSDVAYITNVYPLVERRMTRADCITWLQAHDLPVPPKSACTFCPFKSVGRWRELKHIGGSDWEEALAVDVMIRNKRSKHGLLYVHPGRKPLAEAVNIPEDHGASQRLLEGFEEVCDAGHCGV